MSPLLRGEGVTGGEGILERRIAGELRGEGPVELRVAGEEDDEFRPRSGSMSLLSRKFRQRSQSQVGKGGARVT